VVALPPPSKRRQETILVLLPPQLLKKGALPAEPKAADSASIHTKTGDEAEEQKLHQAIDAEGAIAGEETELTL
jgi:hypothetical protein